MSISIDKARRKLDILEQLVNNPNLLLTDLFTDGVSGINFLYQVNVNGKYILEYLKDYLKRIPVFNGCTVKCESYNIGIYIDSLKNSTYFQQKKIISIDADKRTFKVIERYINEYLEVMKKDYEKQTIIIDKYFFTIQRCGHM
jgi:hypothetical protein